MLASSPRPITGFHRFGFLACRARAGFAILASLLLGCEESPSPSGSVTDGVGSFDATIDPGKGTLILSSTTVPGPDGAPVEVELIGRNLRTEPPAELPYGVEVLLDVSVKNAGDIHLYPPAEITITSLSSGVEILEPDFGACPRGPGWPGRCVYTFLYADKLGADFRQ